MNNFVAETCSNTLHYLSSWYSTEMTTYYLAGTLRSPGPRWMSPPTEDFLLTEPPFNTPENRELMAEMMSRSLALPRIEASLMGQLVWRCYQIMRNRVKSIGNPMLGGTSSKELHEKTCIWSFMRPHGCSRRSTTIGRIS